MFGDPSMQHDPRLEVEPPEDVKDSLTTDERNAAERAYCVSAFDYAEAPVGSRDWTLFWSGWQKRAALSAPATPAKVPDDVARDAERYRYLRNRRASDVLEGAGTAAGVWIDCEDDSGTLVLLTGPDADIAIDAAMLSAAARKGEV